MGILRGLNRWTAPGAEVAVSLTAALVFPLWCTNIKVDPLDRVGQVSGLASMGFRFTVVSIALVCALAIAARSRNSVAFPITARLVCATIAGLATGMIAAGLVVALRGTDYGLNAFQGDVGRIAISAETIRSGKSIPSVYPPLSLHALAWYSDLRGMRAVYAIKDLQIIGTALSGPASYFGWRLLMRPGWALAIGLLAPLPVIEASAYKPYSGIVLIVFLPVVIRFLQVLRRAADHHPLVIVRYGLAFGLAFGVMCILYSGWFKWSAPGLIVAGLVMFPWRTALGRGLLLSGVVFLIFGLVAGAYIHGVLSDPHQLDDAYIYFDVRTEPFYVAMFGGELPPTQVWPPLGELGGVGLFTVLLAVGFTLSVAYGRSRTVVITVASTMAGAWLIRFWYAHLMFKTKLVQLYPRTTHEILFCLLILCGYGLNLVLERARRTAAEDSPLRTPSGMIGAVCGLLFLLGSSASMISNRYMPSDSVPASFGILAWHSQHTKGPPPTPAPPPVPDGAVSPAPEHAPPP